MDVFGFYKQTHWRPGDGLFFTLGSTVHDCGWPKNGSFWTKTGKTWQACQHSKVAQKGSKGTKIVNPGIFVHLDRNLLKMSVIGQNSMKKRCFLPLSCHEWHVMGLKQVSYSYLVPGMIW